VKASKDLRLLNCVALCTLVTGFRLGQIRPLAPSFRLTLRCEGQQAAQEEPDAPGRAIASSPTPSLPDAPTRVVVDHIDGTKPPRQPSDGQPRNT
jgi:hypothetical protein